jgi:hypothetical protein
MGFAMSWYQLQYVGTTFLLSRFSDFELDQYFRLPQTDIGALNNYFRTTHRAGAAVFLLFLRNASRCLDLFVPVPCSLLRHVGTIIRAAQTNAGLSRAMYRRPQTLFAHEAWAKNYLRLRDIDQSASGTLEEYPTTKNWCPIQIRISNLRNYLIESYVMLFMSNLYPRKSPEFLGNAADVPTGSGPDGQLIPILYRK